MSNAYKCDRCGSLYEKHEGVEVVEGGNKYVVMTLAGHGKARTYDLCKCCMTILVNWLNEGSEE